VNDGSAHPDSYDREPFLVGSAAFGEGRCNALSLLPVPTWGWAPMGHQSIEQAERGLG